MLSRRLSRPLLLACAAGVLAAVPGGAALRVEVLRSTGGLPPHIVGQFEEAVDFEQADTGVGYVFDRGGHAVYTIDPARTAARKAVDIGPEQGRVLQPTGFDVTHDGRFVVADAPRSLQRVQTFDATGTRLSGFFLPGQPAARVTMGNLTLNGIGSIQHTGRTLLVSHPESGALFTEYSIAGWATRSIGRLRPTGQEGDAAVHVALNTGLPLPTPDGGYVFVFLAGRPMFRKYDADGQLIFERHVEGRELDDVVGALPTTWPRRRVDERVVPLVTPTIRTAAVDRQGRLWLSLTVPYTYVYDAQGDKIRTVQFMAAGPLSPASLSFTAGGRLLVTPGCYEFDPG